MEQDDCRRFKALLQAQGLSFDRLTHYEHYVFRLCGDEIVAPFHPESVRQIVGIAQEVSGERAGVHAELLGLYALREELQDTSGETRVVTWRAYEDGPSLNVGKWVRLEIWLDDQFLCDDALLLDGPWDRDGEDR